MKIIRQLDELPSAAQRGAVSIGNFDGVHVGHAQIIRRLLAQARAIGGPAVVFTFDPHPVRLLRPDEAPAPLTWTERKAVLLSKLGVDYIIAYPTDEALLQLEPEEFFQQIIGDALAARAMVEGPNFYFGHDRKGTIDRLREMTRASGIALEVVQPIRRGEEYVSSSRIRRLIGEGDVRSAAEMLTEPYRIRGLVTHGAGRGAKLGFPTANIDAIDTLIPSPGVYAGRAWIDNSAWAAAINIGPNPTFGEDALKVEAHVAGYDDSLYGQPLEVDFLDRLRDIERFDSVAALKQQLTRDVERTRSTVDSWVA